jgi:hypothetical protein
MDINEVCVLLSACRLSIEPMVMSRGIVVGLLTPHFYITLHPDSFAVVYAVTVGSW